MRRKKFQLVKLVINAANAEVPINLETDKHYQKISGIVHTSTDDAALKGTVFTKFEINSHEIFPEGFEVKLLHTGLEVSPDERYHPLDEPAGGNLVVGKYKDGGNAAAYPYTATLTLKLENSDEQN